MKKDKRGEEKMRKKKRKRSKKRIMHSLITSRLLGYRTWQRRNDPYEYENKLSNVSLNTITAGKQWQTLLINSNTTNNR